MYITTQMLQQLALNDQKHVFCVLSELNGTEAKASCMCPDACVVNNYVADLSSSRLSALSVDSLLSKNKAQIKVCSLCKHLWNTSGAFLKFNTVGAKGSTKAFSLDLLLHG